MKTSFSRDGSALGRQVAALLLAVSLAACATSSEGASRLLQSQTVNISYLSPSQQTVYVSGGDHTLHALRASDGHQRWSYQLHESVAGQTLVKGVLFVNAGDGSLRAIRASDGQELWHHQDGQFGYGDTFVAAPTVVVYCSYDSELFGFTGHIVMHVLQSSNGQELWHAACGSLIAEGNGVLYSIDRQLSAFQETTGKKLWQVSFPSNFSLTHPAIVGTTIYINAGSDGIYALDATNGKPRWKSSPEADVNIHNFTSVAMDHDMIYAGAGKNIRALNANNGSLLWSTSIEGGGDLLRPLVVGDGKVYVSAGSNARANEPFGFYALRTSDGKLLWRSRVASSDRSLPVVASGRVYVADWQGTLHALRETDGTEVWSFVTGDIIESALALGPG